MKITRHILFLGALLLLPLTGHAQDAPSDGGSYQWTFAFKKGDVPRFRTYLRITGRQADNSGVITIATRTVSRHDIKEVTPDGVAQWEQIDEKAEAVINGMAVAADPKRKPVQITFGKDGRLIKRVNPNADPFDRAEKTVVALQSMPAPPKPVKIGESWTIELPNPVMKNKTFPATSTLIGLEKVLGIDTLKVQVKMDFPSTFGAQESEIIHALITYYLDAKTYQLVRVQHVIKNPLLPFPAANLEARILVSRLVPGQNDQSDPEGEKIYAGEAAK